MRRTEWVMLDTRGLRHLERYLRATVLVEADVASSWVIKKSLEALEQAVIGWGSPTSVPHKFR